MEGLSKEDFEKAMARLKEFKEILSQFENRNRVWNVWRRRRGSPKTNAHRRTIFVCGRTFPPFRRKSGEGGKKMKIAVIGYSGAGKSTLAKALGERYGAEVLYLDQVHWLPGWRSVPQTRKRNSRRRLWTVVADGSSTATIFGSKGSGDSKRRIKSFL